MTSMLPSLALALTYGALNVGLVFFGDRGWLMLAKATGYWTGSL
ncbi:hypothetical protein [Numidum massiliense]|nr:hypothetical protein [Numidum massiliense]